MSRPAIARIHADHLRHNYHVLRQRSAGARLMAVVKANAYGHGLEHVASILKSVGCDCFGVTDAVEGAHLRSLLQHVEAGNSDDIFMLSGIFDAEDAGLAQRHRLTPVLSEERQIALLQQAGFQQPVWIKVETGMHRLAARDPTSMLYRCAEKGIPVEGMISHLACADMPEHPLNRSQADALARHRRLFPQLKASLLNSAGLISLPDQTHDMIRPGIALYGAEPVPAVPLGLKPVMQLCSRIIQVRELTSGDAVSYGASFVASRPMRIGVVALGYADGLPRGLSNIGYGHARGRKLPIIGRICMDYTLVDLGESDIDLGEEVEFWGVSIPANDVAATLGTIAYTLFTGVGSRVKRRLEGKIC